MNKLKLPQKASNIITTLKQSGYEAFAVGGCVRDLMTGRETNDWDFTTNATPEDILITFPDNSFYNNSFGTVGVTQTIDDREEIYEITTYRSDHGYTDNRRPDRVEWGETLEDDLARRDFTINAIAFDGTTIVDPFGGQDDLEQQLIRAVGNPLKRFEEDALRIMRAVRIATQLGFEIEEKTEEAIVHYAKHIEEVSHERVRDELFKILASDHPAEGILLLKKLGLLFYVLPEVDKAFETGQKSPKRHHTLDVGSHLVESLRYCRSKDVIVRFAVLLHDIGKPATYQKTDEGIITFYNHEIIGASIARNIARRLRLSKKDTGKLITLVRWHQFSVDEHQTDSAIRRFIRRIGPDLVPDMMELRRADRLGGGATETSWRLDKYKERLIEVQKEPFSTKDLKIDGNDIMKELDMEPGPDVGRILGQLFEDVIEKRIPNEKNALMKRLDEIE